MPDQPFGLLQRIEQRLENSETRQRRELLQAKEEREKKRFGLEIGGIKAEQERAEAQEKRTAELHQWGKIDRGYERAERGYLLAKKVYKQGDITGAASILTHTYNKHIPDGNEVMIITPQSQPEYWQQLIQTGKVAQDYADAQAILISKEYDKPIPFRNFDELMRLIDEDFNKDNYIEAKKRGEQKIADLNAASFRDIQYAANGEPYVLENYMDDSNIIRQRVVAHDPDKHGPMRESEYKAALRRIGLEPNKLTAEQKKWLEDNTRIQLSQKTKYDERRQKIEDFQSDVEWGLSLTGKGKEKPGLTENQRASLYAKAEKAYRESFERYGGEIPEGVPDKEPWINDYINKATATGADDLVSSPEGANAPKTVVEEFVDKKTGRRKVVYSDGSQAIIGPDDNVIAETQPAFGLRSRL